MRIMTALLGLFLLGASVPDAHAEDGYAQFIDVQWSQLRFPVAKPNEQFALSDLDRSWLNATFDPVKRNEKINDRYFEMGKRLNRCLHSNLPRNSSNWYVIATWASLSANDVISGKKFESTYSTANASYSAYRQGRITRLQWLQDYEIDQAFGLANRALNGLGLDEWNRFKTYFEEQVVLFAETNYQIAAEMIPIGESFLKTFCECQGPDCRRQQNRFFDRFQTQELELKKAFMNYRDAMMETNSDAKEEKILLASIQQVFFEQERVQKNLSRSIDSPIRPTAILNPRLLTLSAGFAFGSQLIKLHRDIRVTTLAPELRKLNNPELVKIFDSLNLDSGDPGVSYLHSSCGNWAQLDCRKRFLAPLFRELASGESELFEY